MSFANMMNDAFTARIGTPDGKEKVADYAGSYIRDRLRELSFARKIVPPQQVTRADCQRSTRHDTLVKIIEIEPESRAMAITFRSQPTARFIRGQRIEAAFFTISSEIFQKNEQELLAYEMPITKIIEENSVKDIQEIEDREFLSHVESAVQALQLEGNFNVNTPLSASQLKTTGCFETSVRKGELARVADTNDATVRPLQRPDIVNLRKMLTRNRLRAHIMLMTETDFDDVLQWTVEDFGDKVQSETTVNGYTYSTLLGLMYVRTIKTDILREGNVFVFAKPEYFGRFFILNNTKFYIDKIANMITFQAWEDISMVVANVAAVRKMELYSADANPFTNADNLLGSFTPVSEEQLGAVNNRVAAGLKFPQVNSY